MAVATSPCSVRPGAEGGEDGVSRPCSSPVRDSGSAPAATGVGGAADPELDRVEGTGVTGPRLLSSAVNDPSPLATGTATGAGSGTASTGGVARGGGEGTVGGGSTAGTWRSTLVPSSATGVG